MPKPSLPPSHKNEIILRSKAHIPECLYKYLQANLKSIIIHHYKPKKKATTDKKFYHTIKVNEEELLDISGYCPYVDGALVLTKPKLF